MKSTSSIRGSTSASPRTPLTVIATCIGPPSVGAAAPGDGESGRAAPPGATATIRLGPRVFHGKVAQVPEHNLARAAEQALERHGDYDSLWFEGEWHRSARLFERATRLAGALRELGVKPGDRIVVLMANCPE